MTRKEEPIPLGPKGERTGQAIVAAMQASPHRDVDLEPERARLPVRNVVL